MTIVRDGDDGEQRRSAMAAITGRANRITMPVDVDIEAGDRLEWVLPNKKTTVVRVTDTRVHQSPFGGAPTLDHTEVIYSRDLTPPQPRRSGDTFNFHDSHVQVATGDGGHQVMNIGQTSEHLALLVRGIGELLTAMNLTEGREAELSAMQQSAVDDITAERPSTGAIRRLADWALDCAKKGGTAATVATVTAVSNGMIHDAETLARAIGH